METGRKRHSDHLAGRLLIPALLALLLSACASGPQTRVWGNLDRISPDLTVAVLPVEILDTDHHETADQFRRSLYANLQSSHLRLVEPYVVDALLEKHNLVDPAKLRQVSPLKLGEVLGADALVFSRINKVERSYFVVHSTMEVGASVKMVDTRNGETLWATKRTESDFSGLAKIPTGISSALLAPLAFVLNESHLQQMTTALASTMTSVLSLPMQFGKAALAKKPEAEPRREEVAKAAVQTDITPEKITPEEPPRPMPVAWRHEVPPQEIKNKPTKERPVLTESKSYYTVQVGAYQSEANAQRQSEELRAKGYNSFLVETKTGDRILFKVRVDRLPDPRKAAELGKRIETRESLKNNVVHVNG